MRCPKCGRRWTRYYAVIAEAISRLAIRAYTAPRSRKLARTGGSRSDTANKGGVADEVGTTGDSGGASTPQWLFDRCNELAIKHVASHSRSTLPPPSGTTSARGTSRKTTTRSRRTGIPGRRGAIRHTRRRLSSCSFAKHWMLSRAMGPRRSFWCPGGTIHISTSVSNMAAFMRIRGPVTFGREDGTTTTLNTHCGTSQLVVVVFGPTIRPGFGTPIRKDGAEPAATTAPDRPHANDADHANIKPHSENSDENDPDQKQAEDIPSVECPYCGRRFSIKRAQGTATGIGQEQFSSE